MPLLWLSLAFLCGIVLGELLRWSLAAWLLCCGLALVLLPLGALFARRRPQIRLFSTPAVPLPYPILLLALALGAARYELSQPAFTPGFVAWYNGQGAEIVVEGVLVEPPDARDGYTNLRIKASQLYLPDASSPIPVRGLVLARVLPGGDWRYGDRLRLQGALQTPPEDEEFSYRNYLARQGIYTYMPQARLELLERGQGSRVLSWIYSLKARSLATIYRLFPDPEASLLAGILLGVETGIPERVQEAFQTTGTTHIIAISGFNMAIVAGLFASLFGRLLGRRKGAVAALLGIGLYTLLVGASAPVVRAAIMSGLALFARQLGRRQHGLNSLAFVAFVMALADPDVLWDVGFQLSFTATLGLILYAEPLSQAFTTLITTHLSPVTALRLSRPISEYFLFTLAAQITSLPVTIYHFKRLSLVSLLANPFILPAQPAVMVLGGLAVLIGLAWHPLGQLAAYLAWPFVVYTIRAVELFAKLPGGSLALGEIALPLVLLFYALLLAWTFARPRLQALSALWKPSLGLSALGVLTVLVWRAALSAPDGRLHLTVLEVGSGDGLLIRSPEGRAVLVDGGPSPSALSDVLGRRLPLGKRELDWLVVAGTGEGQLGGLPRALERFPAQAVLWSGQEGGTRSARLLQEFLTEVQVPVTLAQTGHSLDLGQRAQLKVLAACPRGAVLLLEWRSFQALLPVGLDFDVLDTLLADPGLVSVDALLLAESGYAPANPPEWIDKLRPQVVLLSVAAGDRDGLPDAETLQALAGYNLLRTDRNGWIEVSTDGEMMWVDAAR